MITALCPTYGRFELLRDAVACFLLQTYRPRRLVVLNDAPEPLRLSERGNTLRLPGCTIEVWNAESRYETLGHKRQALLTAAHSGWVAHWDDDDWYLPWHLQQCVDALGADPQTSTPKPQTSAVKPRGAWWVKGPRDSPCVEGVHHNVFEGQMAFDCRAAIDLGGYSLRDSGQAKDLLGRFKNQGTFTKFEPDLVSYCYRWGHRGSHISAAGDGDSWAEGNDDFGAGDPLIPVEAASGGVSAQGVLGWARQRMHTPFQTLLNQINKDPSMGDKQPVKAALNTAYRATT